MSLQYEDFLAFNKELTALIKAGVPLPNSIRLFAAKQNERSREFLHEVAGRLEEGASLDQALGENKQGLPPMYAALVKAGIRSNQLGELLDRVTNYLVILKTHRSDLLKACIYPLVIIFLVYFLMIFIGTKYLENLVTFYDEMKMSGSSLTQFLSSIVISMEKVYWLIPVIYVLLIAWWFATRSTPKHLLEGTWGPLNIIPGVHRYQLCLQKARLCEMLSMLIEQQVPLVEAVNIATDSLGDKKLKVAGQRLIQELTNQPVTSATTAAQYPLKYLEWIIRQGTVTGDLSKKLMVTAESYNHKAETLIIYIKHVYPYLILLGIGIMIVVFYAIMIFLPFYDLINNLQQYER